ncbi:outer membrane protein assembly factor BamB family protein [Cohnella endophytica]|nr:PQQ-binding-like beta-propeller repeat protein [Cohnella endophytica]
MNKPVWRYLFMLLLTVLFAGCTNAPNKDASSSSAEPSAPTNLELKEIALPITTASSPSQSSNKFAGISYDTIKAELSLAMSAEDARKAFGDVYETETSSLYWNAEWVPMDTWTYSDTAKDASLRLYWSPSGSLSYAVSYDRDAQGYKRSYIPAVGAIRTPSSSEDNKLASKYGIRVGQKIKTKKYALGYDLIGSAQPSFGYMADPRREVTITALTKEFVEVNDDGVTAWVPTWYFTQEAPQAQDIPPTGLSIKEVNGAKWYPAAVDDAIKLEAGERVYALRSYGDWYGIAVPDRAGRPNLGLVWVNKNQVEENGKVSSLYDDSIATPQIIASAVRSELRFGLTQKRAEQVFGKPDFLETSDNIAEPGKLKTLKIWRYEKKSTELTITWSDKGELLAYRYRDETIPDGFGIDQTYSTEEPTRFHKAGELEKGKPLVTSRSIDFKWRVRTELPYNYLVGTIGSTLLVAGEDNGFSGMHEASHLYGLDRNTGKRLWKYDFGHEIHLYAYSEESETIVFYKQLESGPAYSKHRLLAIDTKTGNSKWEKTFRVEGGIWEYGYAAADKVVAISYVTGDEGRKTTHIEARDIRTGRLLWSKSYQGEGNLITQNGDRPYLLLQTGTQLLADAKLTALNPLDGKPKWKTEERLAVNEWDPHLTVDRRFPNGQPVGYWTKSVDSLILTDAVTGKTKLALPILFDDGTHYDGIDERYLFKQQSNDGVALYDSKDITSALIDARTGKTLWAVKGKADRGIVEGRRIYFRLDGKPAAANISAGKVIWQTAVPAFGMLRPFGGKLLVEEVADVYTVSKTNGSIDSRLLDVRVGYHEVTPSDQVYGSLTVLGGDLYVGSSNGFFGKVSLSGIR